MVRPLKIKPTYRFKGKYEDGRRLVVVEWKQGNKIFSRSIPKPEVMQELLSKRIKKSKINFDNLKEE